MDKYPFLRLAGENRITGNGEKCFEALYNLGYEEFVDNVDNSKCGCLW